LKAADELRGKVDIDKILALSGSPTAFSAEAKAQANAIFEGLIDLTGGTIIDAKTAVMDTCPMKTPLSKDCTPGNEKEEDDKDKKKESEADKAKAALDALDPLLKAVDADFANQVKVVGGAFITTAKAISTYADAIDKISDLGSKVFNLAAVTMTG